jgi:OOP family OmpA-OmpF porin
MKLISKFILASCVASTLLPVIAVAQDAKNHGYWVSSDGTVVKNPFGLCWRAGYWSPSMANAECDADLVKKAEAPIPAVPLIAAITPAPEPTPAPAAVLPRKISLSADALFDFDKAVLKPEGRTLLDSLVQDLKGVRYDIIAVAGHTDRIGSAAYNQKLSEQRANAVKSYLESKDIPANRISAEGKGETQPATNLADCKGPTSKKVIACLQPDRRVDVDVNGSK